MAGVGVYDCGRESVTIARSAIVNELIQDTQEDKATKWDCVQQMGKLSS